MEFMIDDESSIESYGSESSETESSESEDESSNEERMSAEAERSMIEQGSGSGEDRISSLPDPILAHILSLLPTTKEAIKTSKLSKRWRFLWTSVTSLSFSRRERISSVGDTLFQITSPKLERFKVEIRDENHIQRYISKWIRFAVGRNVEELCVCLRYCSDAQAYKLPEHLFSNSVFTSLVFRGKFKMEPEGSINWKMLRSLRIEGTKLTHHTITNIFTGSPMLETLELGECYGFDCLDIDSPKIRKLVLDGYYESKTNRHPTIVLKINAPCILFLEISGDLRLEDIVLLDVQALLRAKFVFSFSGERNVEQDKHKWKALVQSVNHVGRLSVGASCLEGLSRFEEPLHSTPFEGKLLETEFRRNCLRGLVKLLQSLPDLESLIIMEDLHSYTGVTSLDVDDHLSFKKCDFARLKTVKIIYSEEWVLELIELVQFLQKSAQALEEVIIQAGTKFPKKYVRKPGQRFDNSVSSASIASQRLLLVIKKLFGLCQTDKALIRFEGFDI